MVQPQKIIANILFSSKKEFGIQSGTSTGDRVPGYRKKREGRYFKKKVSTLKWSNFCSLRNCNREKQPSQATTSLGLLAFDSSLDVLLLPKKQN